MEPIPERRHGVHFPCTCIPHPHPVTGRLETKVYDPFCEIRAHRVSASTKREPGYQFR